MDPKAGLIENEKTETAELQVVEKAEPLLTLVPTDDGRHMVLFFSQATGLVVDPDWVGSLSEG